MHISFCEELLVAGASTAWFENYIGHGLKIYIPARQAVEDFLHGSKTGGIIGQPMGL